MTSRLLATNIVLAEVKQAVRQPPVLTGFEQLLCKVKHCRLLRGLCVL